MNSIADLLRSIDDMLSERKYEHKEKIDIVKQRVPELEDIQRSLHEMVTVYPIQVQTVVNVFDSSIDTFASNILKDLTNVDLCPDSVQKLADEFLIARLKAFLVNMEWVVEGRQERREKIRNEMEEHAKR